MGLRLSSVGVGYCGVYALFGIGAVAWLMIRGADHMINYAKTPAVLAAVAERCRPKGTNNDTNYALRKNPRWNDGQLGNCDAVAAFAASRRMAVATSRIAILNYVSPADGQQHQGELLLHRIDRTESLPVGGTVSIYAHEDEPLTIDPA